MNGVTARRSMCSTTPVWSRSWCGSNVRNSITVTTATTARRGSVHERKMPVLGTSAASATSRTIFTTPNAVFSKNTYVPRRSPMSTASWSTKTTQNMTATTNNSEIPGLCNTGSSRGVHTLCPSTNTMAATPPSATAIR